MERQKSISLFINNFSVYKNDVLIICYFYYLSFLLLLNYYLSFLLFINYCLLYFYMLFVIFYLDYNVVIIVMAIKLIFFWYILKFMKCLRCFFCLIDWLIDCFVFDCFFLKKIHTLYFWDTKRLTKYTDNSLCPPGTIPQRIFF